MQGKIMKGRRKRYFFKYCAKCDAKFIPKGRRGKICTKCKILKNIEAGEKRRF